MATVTAQSIPNAGAAPTLAAASVGGDSVECGDGIMLWVVSGSTACTLTIVNPNTNYGDAVADPTFVIPVNSGNVANGAPFGIRLLAARFADANGFALLSWSAITNIKFWISR
jgi:hypothetical protein